MKERFEVDELKVYLGEDFVVNDNLIIKQPTIQEIVDIGERQYFSMVNTLVGVPSDFIAQLYKQGIDWEGIEDFELFCILLPSIPISHTKALFGDVDFSLMDIIPLENRCCYLQHRELPLKIDVLDYLVIKRYLCLLHGWKERRSKKSGNARTKKLMIQDACEELEKSSSTPQTSILRPLISTLVNIEGFKRDLDGVRKMKLGEFMDSVQRVSAIRSSSALLQGCYAGNIDMKKINKDELNYMRDISIA